MGLKRTLVIQKEDGVPLDVKPIRLHLLEASALYVKADLGQVEKFTYNPSVQIFRLIDVSEDCEENYECIPYATTCDVIYLPPGFYDITACPLESKYFNEVMDHEIKVHLIVETIDKVQKDVLTMNANRGC